MKTGMALASGRAGAGGGRLGGCDALFDDCPLPMARVSMDLRLERVNGALGALRGLRPETMIGRPCCEAFGPGPAGAAAERPPCAACAVAKCIETGQAQQFERAVGERFVRGAAWPAWSGGSAAGAAVLLADITAERALWEQLLRTQRLAAIGAATAGVVHELRNPLTTIEGFAQLLRGRGDLSAEAAAQIGRLFAEAQRCTRIAGRLLKFARQKDDGKTILDLNSIVRDSIDLLRYQSEVGGVHIRETYHPAPLLVFGDGLGLQQVVHNVARNALDAIGETRRGGTLDVRTRPDDLRAVAELVNDGPPITDTVGIFQPFYTTKRPGKGTGLGLSVSRAIVQGHGGTIEAENTPRGVVFRIALPTHVAARAS